MIARTSSWLLLLLFGTALVAAGCGWVPPRVSGDAIALPPPAIVAPALAARILALDPEHISETDVKDVLVRGPTPRIMLLHGGIYPVHLSMTSFGHFLVGMGYPEDKIRGPRSGDWSHSPYEDAERLAGIAAWYFEHDRMPPMLIGHSQGGMQAVKVLHVLAGHYGKEVHVWDPLTDFALDRTSIRDPATGQPRAVVGLSLDYVSVIAAGGAAFLLPNQWSLLDKLQDIPDTVNDFTGYTIEVDLWAWTLPGAELRYKATEGHAHVRNVALPATISHVLAPVTADFADDPAARAWIDAYRPGEPPGPLPPGAGDNLLWAADVWWSVKRHWALEAQQMLRSAQAPVRSTGARTVE